MNSTISGNQGDMEGGGISNSGTVVLQDSTVDDNRTYESFGGGGIWNSGLLTITGSTISRNEGDDGGGIQNSGSGAVSLTNSTVSNNAAFLYSPTEGGGIRNDSSGTVYLLNTTVTDNYADYGGGLAGTGPFLVQNTIVAGNTATLAGPNCQIPVNSPLGASLADDPSCGPGLQVVADALLGPLEKQVGPTEAHRPLPGSPAIDAGSNTICPAVDQRGVPRPVDGDMNGSVNCDIGSIEVAPEPARWMLLAVGLGVLSTFTRCRRWRGP